MSVPVYIFHYMVPSCRGKACCYAHQDINRLYSDWPRFHETQRLYYDLKGRRAAASFRGLPANRTTRKTTGSLNSSSMTLPLDGHGKCEIGRDEWPEAACCFASVVLLILGCCTDCPDLSPHIGTLGYQMLSN